MSHKDLKRGFCLVFDFNSPILYIHELFQIKILNRVNLRNQQTCAKAAQALELGLSGFCSLLFLFFLL
jgi:hypothetical protein